MSTKQQENRFRLEIKSRTDSLERARDFVAEAARSNGFGEEDVAKIQLAVDEACTNIIKHAYTFDPDQMIEITIIVSRRKEGPGKFIIRIHDTGKSFDYTQYHGPDMAEYFRRYRVGGLGIMLMKKLMDEVTYSAHAGSPNEVQLVKYLPS